MVLFSFLSVESFRFFLIFAISFESILLQSDISDLCKIIITPLFAYLIYFTGDDYIPHIKSNNNQWDNTASGISTLSNSVLFHKSFKPNPSAI